MKTCVLFFTTILLCSTALAQQSKSILAIDVGAIYSDKKVYRGALIWDAPIAAIFPAITLYDTVALNQDGLSIFGTLGKGHKFTLGLDKFDDNRPPSFVYRVKDSTEDFKNQREDSYGSFLKYEYEMGHLLAVSMTYHRDLKAYKGSYYNGSISTSIIPFVTFGVGVGGGDSKSNKFAYGPEGTAGIGHLDTFTQLCLPLLPGHGNLMVSYNYSRILKKNNYTADYIRGVKSVGSLSVMAMWRL